MLRTRLVHSKGGWGGGTASLSSKEEGMGRDPVVRTKYTQESPSILYVWFVILSCEKM